MSAPDASVGLGFDPALTVSNTHLQAVAEMLLEAERAAAIHRAALLKLMQAAQVMRVEVKGKGFVTYVHPTTTTPIDAKACAAKVVELAGRLKQLGVADVDDAIPMGVSTRNAHLRVTTKNAA